MGYKMVVIDDEEGVCSLLERVFKREGFEVKTELDPYKGIDLVDEFRPDVVIVDVKMPGIDGVDVCAKIKAIEKNIVVIMITAYGELQTAMEAMRVGAFDYITKPFDVEFIKKVVLDALKHKKNVNEKK